MKGLLLHYAAVAAIAGGLLGTGYYLGHKPSPPPVPICEGWRPPRGDVCVKWHNATVLWQWEGHQCRVNGVVFDECPLQQFPTVVCDKWREW